MPQINAQEEVRFLGVTDQRARQKIIITKNPTYFGLKGGQNLTEEKNQVVPNPMLMKN